MRCEPISDSLLKNTRGIVGACRLAVSPLSHCVLLALLLLLHSLPPLSPLCLCCALSTIALGMRPKKGINGGYVLPFCLACFSHLISASERKSLLLLFSLRFDFLGRFEVGSLLLLPLEYWGLSNSIHWAIGALPRGAVVTPGVGIAGYFLGASEFDTVAASLL